MLSLNEMNILFMEEYNRVKHMNIEELTEWILELQDEIEKRSIMLNASRTVALERKEL